LFDVVLIKNMDDYDNAVVAQIASASDRKK